MATASHRRPFVDSRTIASTMLFLPLLLVTPPCAAQSAPSPNYLARNNPANISPSMATVIVVLISAFFFLAFFSVYVRQCAGEAAATAADQRSGVQSGRRRAPQGLSKEVLETFPTIDYSEAKSLKVGHHDLECAVCLSEFEDDESLRLLPRCYHVFHTDCIDSWLAAHVTCPVCRSDLSAADPEPATAQPTAALAPDAADRPPDQVILVIDRAPTAEEAVELARIGSERREARSRRGRKQTKFPRSHSTGHSLTQLGEEADNGDRYTLRLPEHIRREIFAARKLHRSTSCVAFPVDGEGSSRPGYHNGGAGGDGSSRGGWTWRLGKSDRWPSSLIRTLSAKVPVWKKGDGEGSVKKGETEGSSRGRLGSVRTPFDCLGGGAAAGGGIPGNPRGPPQ